MSPTQEDLLALLRELVEQDASELHLKVPARPLLRVRGRLLPTQRPAMTPETTHLLATLLIEMAGVEVPLARVHHHELGFGYPGLGRFHATLYRQRGSVAMIVRRVALQAPSLEQVNLTPSVEAFLEAPGLILLAGGTHRAHALAALVDRYNSSHRGFVVTLEDPLTHLHRDGTATISQRGVGSDLASLAEGVNSARRQRADLIALGDIPDRETAEGVLRAAEERAVVLACVAAPTAQLAPSWILRHYKNDRDSHCAARLKRLLRGVVCVPDIGEPVVLGQHADRSAA